MLTSLFLSLLLIIFFGCFLQTILFIAYDREYARSQKLPVVLFEYLLMIFIALTIISCLRMVGIVMVISLLTLPSMTANLFTHRFSNIIVGAIGIGWVSCTGGLLLSYQLQVPSGASIIFFSILVYALCKIGKSLYICKRSKQ